MNDRTQWPPREVMRNSRWRFDLRAQGISMEPMIRAGDQVSITCCPIGEIMTATGGASACLAPSALSVQSYAESLCDGYYRALGEEHVSYLGDALLEGFLELYGVNPDIAELKSYTIFGDPAQLIWGGARP